MRIFSGIIEIVLVGYIVWQVVSFVPRYHQLKLAVASGDTGARTRVYYHALTFEWVSALLSLLALGFDWSKLNPQHLALDGSRLMQALALNDSSKAGVATGVALGLVLGTVGLVVGRVMANRRRRVAVPSPAVSRLRKLLPDFSALLPSTTQERLLWTGVALSAGICEEIVFRGWLLAALHNTVGLGGTALVATAAVIFGLAHAYQRITGMVLTALAGLLFCVLYVKTGSLLVPILLHALIDVRFAVLPAPRTETPTPVYT